MRGKTANPTEHSLAQVLRWPSRRARDWVIGFLDAAASDPNIIAVIAVGSAVRPGVPSSDVDLVAICRDPLLLKGVRPLEVDLRAYPDADIDASIENGHDVLGWAVRFGRVLFQRDSFWTRLVTRWRHRLPLPPSKVARARAAAAYHRLASVFEFGDADAVHEQALCYLTHLARAELLDRGVYPISRPELAEQLRGIGNRQLAAWLDRLLSEPTALAEIDELVKLAV